MGSPDMKSLMYELGEGTAAADKLWDELFEIKLAFGLYGQSTSVLLLEPSCPALFPAVVDLSFLCADSKSHGENSIRAATDAITTAGLTPESVKSYIVTHLHGDHFDPRLVDRFPYASVYAHPGSQIPGANPLPAEVCPESFVSLDTPGHGTPHCSYIVDLATYDISVLIAGDLIMSHAHFLSLEHPLSFSDHEAGRRSVGAAIDALAARNTKHKMILPGHDIPFFVR